MRYPGYPASGARVMAMAKYAPLAVTIDRHMACVDACSDKIIGARTLRRAGREIPRWDGRPAGHLAVVKHPTMWSTAAHGEVLQWGRYLAEARLRCERVTLAVHPQIHDLARRVFGADVCDERELEARWADVDAYTVLWFELPHALGRLHGTPAAIEPLPERVPALDRSNHHLGVCWAGSGAHANFGHDPNLVSLEQLEPLRALPRTTIHSLQFEPRGATPAWVRVHELVDWDATVGLISALDAVVTVDTGVAHLAASMGKPTQMLLPSDERQCWRWGTEATTPWYPSMRIYRGDPQQTVPQLRDALAPDLRAGGFSLPAVDATSIGAQPIRHEAFLRRYMHLSDLEALLALVLGIGARSVVEIGVNEGRTARTLLDNAACIETYLGIDVEAGYVFERTEQASEIPARPGHCAAEDRRFRLIVRPRGSFDLLPSELPSADLVFIDGDHGRDAVAQDTRLARSIVRAGGVIAWHDVGNRAVPDVDEVLHAMRRAGRDIRRIEGSWIAFERGPCCTAPSKQVAVPR